MYSNREVSETVKCIDLKSAETLASMTTKHKVGNNNNNKKEDKDRRKGSKDVFESTYEECHTTHNQ